MSLPDLTTPPANALSPPSNATTPPSTGNNSSPPPPETPVIFPAPPLTPASNGSSPPTSLPSPPPHSNSELVALGVGAGIGGAFVLILVGIFIILYRTRKRRRRLAGSSDRPPEEQKDEHFNALHLHEKQDILPSKDHVITVLPDPDPPPKCSSKITFTYEELSQATDGFSNANLLGEGGFGYVHKGVLLNGKEVAVKQLKTGSGQGEREFQAEVEFIGRVSHKHLVSLVGYCISGIQRLLVYEFVPNNTLEFHLHGKGRQPLCWTRRMKIARGSAKGLAYLHEDCKPKIIHRDIKAVNILLDYDFEAKVADFGLARLNFDADTHISTRVMGTFGYLAPEYALTGKLTDKSDVFSFGVVLLELITGRRPIDKSQFPDGNIVDWARPLLTEALEEGSFDSLVDPRLQKDYDITEMTCMIACASVCVRHLARRRPKLIQIVRALEGNISIDELNDGIRPDESSAYGSHDSLDYDASQYKEDLRKFKKLALGNKDQTTSECSGPTSEFDVRPSASSSEIIQTTQEITSSSEHHRTIPVT